MKKTSKFKVGEKRALNVEIQSHIENLRDPYKLSTIDYKFLRVRDMKKLKKEIEELFKLGGG